MTLKTMNRLLEWEKSGGGNEKYSFYIRPFIKPQVKSKCQVIAHFILDIGVSVAVWSIKHKANEQAKLLGKTSYNNTKIFFSSKFNRYIM